MKFDSAGEFFVKAFGFKNSHETFERMVRASENPGSFHSIDDFWRFKELFGRLTDSYDAFQSSFNFHFLSASTFGIDADARLRGSQINETIFTKFFVHFDEPWGFRPHEYKAHGPCTINHTRHCMLLTQLMVFLPLRKVGSYSFCEIGGGYGNFPRLMDRTYGFKSWTIFDLDFVTKLQKEYADRFIERQVVSVPKSQRDLYLDANDPEYDVAIATHSLSEMPDNEFAWYKNNILRRARYIYYVSQQDWPYDKAAMYGRTSQIAALGRSFKTVDLPASSSVLFVERD